MILSQLFSLFIWFSRRQIPFSYSQNLLVLTLLGVVRRFYYHFEWIFFTFSYVLPLKNVNKPSLIWTHFDDIQIFWKWLNGAVIKIIENLHRMQIWTIRYIRKNFHIRKSEMKQFERKMFLQKRLIWYSRRSQVFIYNKIFLFINRFDL